MKTRPSFSFVIPTRNEAQHISEVIQSIRSCLGDDENCEIVVADNGSTDETREIARRAGARVLLHENVTVAALRNAGAASTGGDILVFLDGDVLLTPEWGTHIRPAMQQLLRQPMTVTGSRCGISRAGSWIERFWFTPLLTEQPNYINSGHLITTRFLFERLRGFDERLETGEDSDFSRRARELGAAIVNNPELAVIHEGYPKTLKAFIRRERWHGRGNFMSLATVLRSRVALLTATFVAAHIGILTGLFTGTSVVALASGTVAILLCVLSAATKYRRAWRNVAANSFLYYWYFAARGVALLEAITARLVAVLSRARRPAT